jgi:hypothetical protein
MVYRCFWKFEFGYRHIRRGCIRGHMGNFAGEVDEVRLGTGFIGI